jgi:hypothetical protein
MASTYEMTMQMASKIEEKKERAMQAWLR